MIVTIWRHGQAGNAATDQSRVLTTRGREDIRLGGQQFLVQCDRRGLASPSRILYSRWQRTTQTAELLNHCFAPGTCQPSEALIPGARVRVVDTVLEQQLTAPDAPPHLVLVSHQPLVSDLASHYLGSGSRVPHIPPGGLVCLDLSVVGADCAGLCWWAVPPRYDAQR